MTEIDDFDIDEIKIGYTKNFKITLTEQLLQTFSKLSGDNNPLHVDEDYARTTKFKSRVIPGMLLASFFSRLVGVYIPGKKALFVSQTLKFINPAFVGDEIIISGKVLTKSNATRLITMETKITNLQGQSLVKGESKVLVRDEVE